MKIKKYVAIGMAALMTFAGSITAFAEQEGGDKGTGTSYDHVETEIIDVVLPTNTAGIFNYTVDPERLIQATGKIQVSGGDFETITVADNDVHEAGVYFKHSDNVYSNTSQEAKFEGRNSVAVDVTVKVKLENTDDNDIAFAASEDAFNEAEEATVLLEVNVGDKSEIIDASNEITVTNTIAGSDENFTYGTSAVEGYIYTISGGDASALSWNSQALTLTGKVNKKSVPSGGKHAPDVKLTWSIAKHADSYVSATSISDSSKEVTLSLPNGVTVSKLELILGGNTIALTENTHYTISGTKLTVTLYDGSRWAGGDVVITYSDEHQDTLECE